MIYAQFYHYDTTGKLAEACGDRSVVIIDARLHMTTIGEIATEECKKRGYVAWAIFQGQSFTNSHPLSDPCYVLAGMRCYVASRLGDEVDVPDELI